jgi:hypothetical protein
MAGFDTGSTVNDVWQGAKAKYGTPLFWIRYFTPTTGHDILNTSQANANSECEAIWSCNSSSPMLGPVSYPVQSTLNGSQSTGSADAQMFANAMVAAWLDVAPLEVPNNDTLISWLDLEASYPLSVPYWNGWSYYIDVFNGFSSSEYPYPLYTGLYCNPDAAAPNCSTLLKSSYGCFAVWASAPTECGYSLSDTPPWKAESCSVAGDTTPTYLWQFGSEDCPPCCYVNSASDAVDLDVGAPGFYYPDYCFYLSANP